MRQLRQGALLNGCLAVLAGLFACSRSEPRSPIVEKVEKAGSGPLVGISKDSLREWLGEHKAMAYQVDEVCKPVRQKATALWSDSTEGRLCAAAREVAFLRSGPVTSDEKTYLPGLK